MSEEANTRLGEDQGSPSSGLLLSVVPMQEGEPERSAQRVDNVDTDTDMQDTGDASTDADGTDTSDSDRTDAGGDSDETDTLGDTDLTDAVGDSDGTDSGDSDGTDS
jgi:hypothetical protein